MVYFDEKKEGKRREREHEKWIKKRKEFERFCEENSEVLDEHGLSHFVSGWGYAGIIDVLRGDKALDRCVFDGGELIRSVGGFRYTSGQLPRTVYECGHVGCDVKYYDLPLNEEDMKKWKRASSIPIGAFA